MVGKSLNKTLLLQAVVVILTIGAAGMLLIICTPPAEAQQQSAQVPPPTPPPERPQGVTAGMLQDPQTGQWYTPMQHAEYAFGADLSSIKQLEEGGKIFKDTDGQPKPVLRIFRNHGYNWIRLRVCVPPVRLPQSIEYTTALAKQAKKLGFKYLLDFHYSNGWADPTNEPTPSTWQGMPIDAMVHALFEYTRDTIAAMTKEGALPDIIQVGNEIGNGFLWPTADIRKGENWDSFARLIQAGVNGIDAGRGNGKRPLIMIHVDHGGNIPLTRAFFDKFNTYGIGYDTIGISFYPWSHGTLMDLRANLAFAANAYGKDIYLVETGYYHTPSQYFRSTPGPFPETPEGQAQWLEAVNHIIMDTPGGHGKGIFWWEPAGGQGLVNRGYFDREGNAKVPVFEVFHKFTRPAHRTDNQ